MPDPQRVRYAWVLKSKNNVRLLYRGVFHSIAKTKINLAQTNTDCLQKLKKCDVEYLNSGSIKMDRDTIGRSDQYFARTKSPR
jgi:hypothetical protein